MQAWIAAIKEAARRGAEEDEARYWGWRASAERPYPFSYRWEHVQQVVRNGIWLAQRYEEADADVVLAACWLHDAKKAEKEHALRGAEFAQALLEAVDFPREKVGRVAEAISLHEGLYRPAADWREDRGDPFRAGPPLRPLEAAILWDADKLAKIGPVSHFHFLCWSVARAVGTASVLTTLEAHTRNAAYIRDIVPRTIASMNTEAARQQALAQHEAYLAYHRALDAVLVPDT